MRRLATLLAAAGVLAVSLVLLGGNGTVPAHAATNLNVHVHDDFYHPAGTFLVANVTDHAAAQAACEVPIPDSQCDASISVGDTITWVSPAPLAANLHTVTECTNATFTVCGPAVSAVSPINDSGVRNPPSPGPSGWPYGPILFNDPGVYYYRCEIHPATMRGRVLVVAGSVGGAVEQLTDSPTASSSAESAATTTGYLLIAGLTALLAITISAGGVYAWKRTRRE